MNGNSQRNTYDQSACLNREPTYTSVSAMANCFCDIYLVSEARPSFLEPERDILPHRKDGRPQLTSRSRELRNDLTSPHPELEDPFRIRLPGHQLEKNASHPALVRAATIKWLSITRMPKRTRALHSHSWTPTFWFENEN